MKKLFSLLLTLAMLLGCVAGAEVAVDYVGTWVLTSLETGGMTIDMTMLAQRGMDMTMTLNEDGTMFTKTMGVTENGTWVVTETGIAITDDEETIELTYENDALRMEDEGAAMLLTREGAAPVAAEEISFPGTWVLMGLEMNGMTADPAALGIAGSMVLNEDGTCVLTMMDASQNGTWAVTETGLTTTDAEGTVDAYTVAEGKLRTEADGMTLIFGRAQEKVEYVGMWELTGVKAAGLTLAPDQMGLQMTLYVYEDGTCEMVTLGVPEQGTWAEVEGGIAITDASADTLVFAVQDGALVAEQEGMTLILTPAEYAQPMSGLTAADFNGEWVFVYAEYMGQVLDTEALGMSADLSIKDGAGHVDMVFTDGTESYDAVCEIEEVEDLGTVMYFLYIDAATGEATEYGMMLMLYSDGELVWYNTDSEGNDIYYCFVNTAE